MVRLKDIAARAGVTIMTVSKVLRDAPDISPATKATIRALAQEMGYVPNSVARSLRDHKTRLFGLVIPAATHPLISRTLMAIEEKAYEMGYEIAIAQSLNMEEREEEVIHRLMARHVDGLFLFPVYRMAPSAPIYEELRGSGLPTVIIGQRAPFCQAFPNVETNDLLAASAVTWHLLGLGHRRIAFLAGPSAAPWAQERIEGYRRAQMDAHLEPNERMVFLAGGRIEDGEKAAEQALQEMPDLTAFQAVNDLVAIGALRAALKHGLKVPEQISIAGFGDVLLSEHGRVPLTTQHQPKYRLGLAAMDAMQRLLKGEPAGTQQLESNLIIRQSTGPVAR